VRKETVLHRVKEERKVVGEIKRRDVNWIGHTCFVKHIVDGKIEGRIEVTVRRRRRPKQLLDDLKGTREY
jgi:hypothetical protein